MVTAMEGWFGADTSSCGKAERVYDIDAITPGVRQQLFDWAARAKDRRGFELIISGVWESTVWYKVCFSAKANRKLLIWSIGKYRLVQN